MPQFACEKIRLGGGPQIEGSQRSYHARVSPAAGRRGAGAGTSNRPCCGAARAGRNTALGKSRSGRAGRRGGRCLRGDCLGTSRAFPYSDILRPMAGNARPNGHSARPPDATANVSRPPQPPQRSQRSRTTGVAPCPAATTAAMSAQLERRHPAARQHTSRSGPSQIVARGRQPGLGITPLASRHGLTPGNLTLSRPVHRVPQFSTHRVE